MPEIQFQYHFTIFLPFKHTRMMARIDLPLYKSQPLCPMRRFIIAPSTGQKFLDFAVGSFNRSLRLAGTGRTVHHLTSWP
jgi:hypothetical protein